MAQHNNLVEFNLHKESVSDVKWSSHKDKALLASASDDNYVYVWNVDNSNPIAMFNEHRSRVFSVEWNHIDFDLLFSGGQDKFIYEWDYKDFVYEEKKNVEATKYHRERFALLQKKKKRKEAPFKNESASSATTNTSTPAKKKSKTSSESPGYILNVAQNSENSTSRIKREQYCVILADKLLDGKVTEAIEAIKRNLKEEQLKDATVDRYINFLGVDNTQKEQHQNIHELLYGDKNDIRRLIELEGRVFFVCTQTNIKI